MDKILSLNTIKNVFSALGAKTSDSNYGVALLDKTSGEPKGFMGMSDLASLLGGVLKPMPASQNLDDAIEIGTYRTYSWTSYTGIPDNMTATEPGTLVVLPGCDGAWRTQTIYLNNREIWQRSLNMSGAAKVWQRIDNYGTSSLSELASALGVLPYYQWQDGLNANDLITGLYYVGEERTNIPGNTYGMLLTGFGRFQLFISADNRFFVRTKPGTDWNVWREITTQS